jgi:hypothetical protein
MNNALHRFCFALWGLGFLGMGLTKGSDAVGELPFAVATRCFLVGVLSLCFLAGLDLCERARRRE